MTPNLQITLFIACFGFFTSIVLAKTDSQDVSALNDAYKNLNSPSKLNGWSSNGGDPCGDSWDGITCKGSSVTQIKVSGRGLSGSLGYQLEKLRSLTYLDVSKNNLNGNLPYQLPQNLVYLDGSENDFNGNVPYSVSLMNDLTYLNLAKNNLNGELSDMFQKLPKLETIDLSANQLTGKLPQSFANLTGLKTLHLQENQFKGSINSLRDLPKIDDVNVANNQFTGWIPNELKNIGNLETQGNQWSTGRAPSPPPGTRHIDRNSEGGGGGNNKSLITGIIIAVSVIGGLIVFAGLIALFSRRRNSHLSSHFFDEEKEGGTNRNKPLFTPQTSQILQFDTMEEFKGEKTVDSNASTETKPFVRRTSSVSFKNSPTFHLIPCNQVVATASSGDSPDTRGVKAFALEDLQNSASGFSPNRLIGEGTIGRVYKAKYQDGKKLAVKEIDSSLLGNPEEFSHMVSSISSIHHPNMAELVGYCSEQGRHMLVYEYYTSGSLHKFLHLSDDFSNPLTWNTRIRIALGTAQAIEYLHVCSPPLLHKNIKSSNILLDSELTPHLSDYGMANFHHRTSQNLGVGYNAPECTDPSAYTLKSDVYSLGVVMLELLTGRTPYDSNRPKQEQSLVRWAKPQLKDMDALMEMADPALCGLFAPESVSTFADIVSTCVMAEPELRPEVSNVVEALKRLV